MAIAGQDMLLERTAQLDALDAAFAATASGGRLVLLAGEAGVGKTVLLRRFCERSEARILWGDCDALFTLSPLGPAPAQPPDRRGPGARGRQLPRRRARSRPPAAHRGRRALAPRRRAGAADAAVGRGRRRAGDAARGRRRRAPPAHGRQPFFVTEALAAGGVELPATVRDAVLARVAPLSPPARRLLERRSHECYLADEPAEAIAAQQLALACHRQLGDRRREGEALRALSSILWCPGDVDEAERAAGDAVAVLEPLGPGRELAMAYANRATLAMNHEDADGTAEWGGRALALARELGAEAIEVNVLNTLGTMEFLAGGPAARMTAERSLELALAAGLVQDALRAYANLVWAALRHRALSLADRYLQAATDYASDPELDLWWTYLAGYRARAELDQGRWAEAADTAALVLRGRRASPLPVVLSLTAIGRLWARRGDPDPWSPLDEALALAGPELQRIEPVAIARAEAAWLAGDRDRVLEEAGRIEALARRCNAAWIAGEAAVWRRRAGDEAARAPDGTPHALELAGRADEAAERWTALGLTYEAALARAGSADRDSQRSAHRALLDLGAPAAAAAVARELRRRGAAGVPRGPRTATRENPAQLTARELDVLALVADGLRNRDIAERLVLSTKTVEHHVASILGKLGARTRGQAGAQALRDGLVRSAATRRARRA